MKSVEIPPSWEAFLKRFIKEKFYTGTRKGQFAERAKWTEGDYRFFAKGVGNLNVAFTQERGSLPRNYFNQKELRSGYLLYFLPVNALKVGALLREGLNPPIPPLAKGGEGGFEYALSILDLGCGPGTGMFGTMLHLDQFLSKNKGGKLNLQWLLVDQNRQVLHDARSFHELLLDDLRKRRRSWTIDSKLTTRTENLFSMNIKRLLHSERFDLILGLNFLSELPGGKRFSLVENLLRHHLSKRGRFLIIEPALQRTTRDLMELHDRILGKEAGFVEAPCLHQSACPMLLANKRDWCHTYIPWERPKWIEKIDRLVGIRKDYLKCSYMILGREKKEWKLNTWRVVSGHLNSKGKSERLFCPTRTPVGRPTGTLPKLLRVCRLDRDESETNRDFDRAQRGDLVEMEKRERINQGTVVRLRSL